MEGLVQTTIPAQVPDGIALLRLDTDLYDSTLHELEHLYPRLASGGVLIVDDYGKLSGATKAVDEYFAALPAPAAAPAHRCPGPDGREAVTARTEGL